MKNLAFACIVALFLTGCDFLQIEPKQSISSEQALTGEQNVTAALNGAYNDLSDNDLYGGQYMMSPDLLADAGDVQWVGTFAGPAEIIRKNIQTNNGFIELQWTEAYEAINDANNVLSALDQIENQQERERVEGEARFIRAALYFELVRLYGQPWNAGDPSSSLGVPLILEPTRDITEEDNVTRNSVQAVYDQVLTDLTTARDLLPATNGAFADTYAASAFLSRVYLMQGEYQSAAEAADRVLESDHELETTFAGAFNNVEDVPEYVFSIQVSSQDGQNDLNTFYAAEADGGRGDINIQQQHLDRYAADDERGDFFYTDPGTGDIRTQKWQDDESDGANIPVVRLAEMYLTRAEGNLRSSGPTVGPDPVDDVNTIRNRADLNSVSSVTINDVLRQRRLELSFEGHLLHDLKRTGRSVGSIPFDANELVYPVPQRECDANPEITQNPGYTSC